MQRLIFWIGLSLLLGWTAALLINFETYQNVTTNLTVISPLIDGLIFMLVMFALYVAVWQTAVKNKKTASWQLGIAGALAMALAFVV
ncbi:hypothetical protein [Salisediminibacterium halotolerans]|uniref:hypothetical protein n=1 Tax=Salisediminibacterium halotolerans TaxID=517425 RepID=UPI000EB05EE2|nr:hypothetical protein [Salisediminibacterium halotolerans]RLJ81064.1 hypothetical protein BCL39_0001 [Actinophytocola xinjiangensis]RPE84127.1 hypothetical protein EDD67_2690 [Salisediminibacterium halotolerans]TWG38491.1 hypothetical protein BCL52_0001 [Salisediminibacterium halotolerans]GEL09241.1 hypothetical protein SHA02_26570 [Salisediminibacterium halotolerans]